MPTKPKDPFKDTDKIYCYIEQANAYCEIEPFLYWREKVDVGNRTYNNPILFIVGEKAIAMPAVYFNFPVFFGSKVKTIEQSFLRNCKNFNQPIDMSHCTEIESIGSNFLNGCWKFNSKIKLPPNIKSIGQYFMFRCKEYNKQLSIPNKVVEIADNFLNQCKAFNKKIDFNNTTTLQTIGKSFCANNFNMSGTFEIPKSVTHIGRNFLMNTKIKGRIELPPKLEYLGLWFLENTDAFAAHPYPKTLQEKDRKFYDKVVELHNDGYSYQEIEDKLLKEPIFKEYRRMVGWESYTVEYPISNIIKYKMKQITDMWEWPKIQVRAFKKKD